jgi:hypothetical protein
LTGVVPGPPEIPTRGARGRFHLKQIFKAGSRKTTRLVAPRGRRISVATVH